MKKLIFWIYIYLTFELGLKGEFITFENRFLVTRGKVISCFLRVTNAFLEIV